jgi:hypothetical protein
MGQSEDAGTRLGLNESGEFSPKSVLASMGGKLGIAESVIPGFIFIGIYTCTKQQVLSVIAATLVSLGFIIYRVSRKKVLTQALVGLIGVGLTAFLVLREGGQAGDFFIPALWTNISYGTVLLISILVRWPLIGVLYGLFTGHPTKWRKTRGHIGLFSLATAVWVTLFASRLLVQVPLYYSNQVELLGVVHIVMGVPLYLATAWISWLVIRRVVVGNK